MIPAIILAAGFSRRLGRPKSLLDFGGEPLIAAMVDRLVSRGLTTIIVSNERDADAISEALGVQDECGTAEESSPDDTGTNRFGLVVNPNPDAGRNGSVKIGLEAAGANASGGALIVPVDRPGWSSDTLDSLLAHGGTACPSLDGRGGHPLLLSAQDVERILAAPVDAPLNSLVDPEWIEVDDEWLHLDVDTEGDLTPLTLLADSDRLPNSDEPPPKPR